MATPGESTPLGSPHPLQRLVGSRHLSALLSPSPLSHLGSGLRVPSIPSWPGPSSPLQWGGQCLLSTPLPMSVKWDHDT